MCSCRAPVFFCQAEDGIRDLIVTGVQTCALPISAPTGPRGPVGAGSRRLTHRLRGVESPHRVLRPLRRVPPAWRSISRQGTKEELSHGRQEIGRAACRERVLISVVAVSLKKKERV